MIDESVFETFGNRIDQFAACPDIWLKIETLGKEYFIENENQNHDRRKATVFDLMVVEEGRDGKSYWHNVGVGFPLSNGSNGYSLKLHFFPHLRLIFKESIRPVGTSKGAGVPSTPNPETPF